MRSDDRDRETELQLQLTTTFFFSFFFFWTIAASCGRGLVWAPMHVSHLLKHPPRPLHVHTLSEILLAEKVERVQ